MTEQKMTDEEMMVFELKRLARLAELGELVAFLAVTVQKGPAGLFGTVNTVTTGTGDVEQGKCDTLIESLHGVSRALMNIYDPPAVVTGNEVEVPPGGQR